MLHFFGKQDNYEMFTKSNVNMCEINNRRVSSTAAGRPYK